MVTICVILTVASTVYSEGKDEMERPSRLTQAFVDSIKSPGRFSDGRRAFGLSLLVKPLKDGSGFSKTYSQRLRMPNGKTKTLGLGPHPVTSLKVARETAFTNAQAARASRANLPSMGLIAALSQAQTANPMPIVSQSAIPASVTVDAPTFREVAEMTIDALAPTWKDVSGISEWKNNTTRKQWESQLSNYVYPRIGNLPVNRLASADVVMVLSNLWVHANPTAKQLKMKLSKIFDHAIANNWIETNPVERAEKALPRVKREINNRRALPCQEVPQAMPVIRQAKVRYPAARLGLEFMILTATRRNETLLARWAEIDMDAALWIVPGERMKSGREHRIPLSRQAVAILEGIERNGSEFVFTGSRGKPMSENTYRRLLVAEDIDSSVHGFRSAFRTWAEEQTDASHAAKENALAHIVGTKIETPYTRTDMLEERVGLMQEWADYILPTD